MFIVDNVTCNIYIIANNKSKLFIMAEAKTKAATKKKTTTKKVSDEAVEVIETSVLSNTTDGEKTIDEVAEITEELVKEQEDMLETDIEVKEDTAQVEENIKAMKDILEEIHDSNDKFNEAVMADPAKTGEIIETEMKKLDEIEKKIPTPTKPKRRVTYGWNGFMID